MLPSPGKIFQAIILALAVAAMSAAPAPALTPEQVIKLRQAGVSNETIKMLIDNEIKVKRQGGVGVYTIKQRDGREQIVYEAASPRGVIDYNVGLNDVDSDGGMDSVSMVLDAPRLKSSSSKAAKANSGPYTLHLASFRSQARAKKMVEELAKKGVTARIKGVDLGKKGYWHRVLVGSYPNRQAAESQGRALKTKGAIESFRPIKG